MPVRSGRSGRYATALFSIAREQGTAESWAVELRRLGAVLSDPQTLRVLTSPGVSIGQKQQALEEVAGPVAREVSSLLTILFERKRIGHLPALAEAFDELIREDKGIELAEVTTAVQLPAADQQSVSRWLSGYLGRAVEVRYQIDPEIIGGLVARVGDQLIDASVRGRLESLRKTLRSA